VATVEHAGMRLNAFLREQRAIFKFDRVIVVFKGFIIKKFNVSKN
jgi:hypothetical protein